MILMGKWAKPVIRHSSYLPSLGRHIWRSREEPRQIPKWMRPGAMCKIADKIVPSCIKSSITCILPWSIWSLNIWSPDLGWIGTKLWGLRKWLTKNTFQGPQPENKESIRSVIIVPNWVHILFYVGLSYDPSYSHHPHRLKNMMTNCDLQ